MPSASIRRTFYWMHGQCVSLAYVPNIDGHPEVTNDNQPPPELDLGPFELVQDVVAIDGRCAGSCARARERYRATSASRLPCDL